MVLRDAGWWKPIGWAKHFYRLAKPGLSRPICQVATVAGVSVEDLRNSLAAFAKLPCPPL